MKEFHTEDEIDKKLEFYEEISVKQEDIYYTLLFYSLNEEYENSTDSYHPRRPHKIGQDDIYLNITGTIELHNSFGYLNAE